MAHDGAGMPAFVTWLSVGAAFVTWLAVGALGGCSDATSASNGGIDASVDQGSVDANAPCCAVAEGCLNHRNDAGFCDQCCHGDACGYPPEVDGTCSGPVGPGGLDAQPPPTGCPADCNEVTVVFCANATASACECQGNAPFGCETSRTAVGVVCCDAACPAACKAISKGCIAHTCVCAALDAGQASNCAVSGIGGPVVDGGAAYCCQ